MGFTSLLLPDYFLDWPTCGTPDAKVGVQYLAIWAVKRAEELLSRLGLDASPATRILKRLALFSPPKSEKKQVLAMKYFAYGALNEEEHALLVKGGAEGLSTFTAYYVLKAVARKNEGAAISMMKEYYGGMLSLGATTFWEDFDLSWIKNACPIHQLPEKGQEDIHGDRGAHCYLGYRHSLCHGWSAGVIRFIKEYCK